MCVYVTTAAWWRHRADDEKDEWTNEPCGGCHHGNGGTRGLRVRRTGRDFDASSGAPWCAARVTFAASVRRRLRRE